MADIPQVIATYDALVGVALGAGLTYGFGALNRRHQEAREDITGAIKWGDAIFCSYSSGAWEITLFGRPRDKTCWYQARLDAYADFYRALSDSWLLAVRDQSTQDGRDKLVSRLSNALGLIQLVGSPEVVLAANALFKEAIEESKDEAQPELAVFVFAARKDLGDTPDRYIQREIDRALPLDEDN